MSKVFHNKLVRDNMREVVAADGNVAEFRTLGQGEIQTHLKKKLVEEAKEYAESGDIEELADVLAVVRALARFHPEKMMAVLNAERLKELERGGFREGLFMVWHEAKEQQ